MSITVSKQDVTDAEDFIAEYLTDKIPEGDYTQGAMLRDLAVKGIAFVVAYLKTLNTQTEARQSLLSITTIDTSDDAQAADDAVDAILSNWFATRKAGTYARVQATATLSDRVDVTVRKTDVFYKTASLPFVLDYNGEDYQVAAEDLLAQYDSSGLVIGYTFTFPLISQNVGTSFNIDPGTFVSYDQFSPYVTKVETLEKSQYGKDVEATADFIERSKNLITVRNLINARSCDAVLRDQFTEVNALSLIGMGDHEMIRDYVKEGATGIALHTGGCQDVFVNLPVIEVSASLQVGGTFVRPDGVVCVFRDITYAPYDAISNPTGHRFTDPDPVTLQVPTAGMVLRIWDGLTSIVIARDYMITEVRDTEILVTERVPFTVATDEMDPPGYVVWSIGQNAPDYRDVVGADVLIETGETSRAVKNTGRVTLPGGPVYLVKEVTIYKPADPDADPTDGLIHFYNRMNTAPVAQVAPNNEYQVIEHRIGQHQSMRTFTEVLVGPVGTLSKYDGETLKVTYDTLSGFASVADYVENRRQRIAAANPLTRAYHPAYLRFTLEYSLKKTATTTVDATEAASLLTAFINTFDPREGLDVTSITDFFRSAYADVGKVFPFTIYYDVHCPDGRVIQFASGEEVTVPSDPDKLNAVLITPNSSPDGLTNPYDFGLSDDVIRYMTRPEYLEVKQRS